MCEACVGALCVAQEKQKASAHQIEELSEKVNALELEKRQLQKALELATAKAQVRSAARTHLSQGPLQLGLQLAGTPDSAPPCILPTRCPGPPQRQEQQHMRCLCWAPCHAYGAAAQPVEREAAGCCAAAKISLWGCSTI